MVPIQNTALFAGKTINSYGGVMEQTSLLFAREVRGDTFEGIPKYGVRIR